MKVAKLYSFYDIRTEDVPIPEIGPFDALVKTKACGICSGDVMPWYIEKKAPLVIGHEPAGEVVSLGEQLHDYSSAVGYPDTYRVGDRVFVHHHAPCFSCRHCARGDYVQCSTWGESHIIPGGVAEYFVVPRLNLFHDTLKLPKKVSYEDATLIEPTACVVKSLRRASFRAGDTVLVIGLGVMGQLHTILARSFGAKLVIGADMIPSRLEKARSLGADHAINVSKEDLRNAVAELTLGEMADVVIVGPNSAEAMKQGIEVVGRGGTVVFFTPAKQGELLTFDPNDLYFRDVCLVSSYSCGPDDTRQALTFIEQGTVSAEKLVTHRFTIDETDKAFRVTAEARDSLKCVIVF